MPVCGRRWKGRSGAVLLPNREGKLLDAGGDDREGQADDGDAAVNADQRHVVSIDPSGDHHRATQQGEEADQILPHHVSILLVADELVNTSWDWHHRSRGCRTRDR